MAEKFTFVLNAEVTLDSSLIWPEGDGPENPELSDVLELLENLGYHQELPSSMISLFRDWNLFQGAHFQIFEAAPAAPIPPVVAAKLDELYKEMQTPEHDAAVDALFHEE